MWNKENRLKYCIVKWESFSGRRWGKKSIVTAMNRSWDKELEGDVFFGAFVTHGNLFTAATEGGRGSLIFVDKWRRRRRRRSDALVDERPQSSSSAFSLGLSLGQLFHLGLEIVETCFRLPGSSGSRTREHRVLLVVVYQLGPPGQRGGRLFLDLIADGS